MKFFLSFLFVYFAFLNANENFVFQEQDQEEQVVSQNIFLSYIDVPKRVYVGQIVGLKVKAIFGITKVKSPSKSP
jgi:hypothetical protein